jgi:hypothetical protein
MPELRVHRCAIAACYLGLALLLVPTAKGFAEEQSQFPSSTDASGPATTLDTPAGMPAPAPNAQPPAPQTPQTPPAVPYQDPGNAVPPAVQTPSVPQPHGAPSGQGRRGFVVMASLGVRPLNFSPSGTGSTPAAVQGDLAIGFKVGRVMLTFGVDLSAVDTINDLGYQPSATFLFVPGLQIAMYRSRDQRVELIGSLRFGAGAVINNSNAGNQDSVGTPVLVMYEIAPAVRYWMHRQFAVQFLAGYGGQYAIDTGSSNVAGTHSLVSSIGAIGLF